MVVKHLFPSMFRLLAWSHMTVKEGGTGGLFLALFSIKTDTSLPLFFFFFGGGEETVQT